MNYKQACDYLHNLQFHKIKLGLDSMRSFLKVLGNPQDSMKFVHVAGTNGKGSVCSTIVSMLSAAGYRVGIYTSPHLSSVRERFRINNDYISEEKFAALATIIQDTLGDDKITYFEFTTTLAFLWFAESDLDLVVLETGLGGRLDATNIVTPLVSVITNVSMDHEAYLGDTLEAVSGEKAGIIKKAVPVVSAVDDNESRVVVQNKCIDQGSPLYLLGVDFNIDYYSDLSKWSWRSLSFGKEIFYDDLKTSMKGDYQIVNASLAIAVMQILKEHNFMVNDDHIRSSLLSVKWPGRLEGFTLRKDNRDIRYLLDGAHNPAGVDSLVNTVEKEYDYKSLILVWGAMVDKDLVATLPKMATIADTIILTRPDGERSADPELLYELLDPTIKIKAELVMNVQKAIEQATENIETDDLVVVAGSLYLVGEARKILLGELV